MAKNYRDGLQAIQTKHVGATNFKGTRVKATCSAGSVTLSWDHALNGDGNHRAAAEALMAKFGWKGTLYGGGLKDGSMVWVQVQHDKN